MSGLLAPNAPQPQPGFWRGLLDAFGQDAAAARAWFVSNMQRASGGGILGEGETDTGARAGAGMALGALGMTGAMPGGVFAAPRGAVMGAGPIRAFHGSPHDFDKFDIRKIGTGEGAQAYGHGLYFAENEGVARSYRDAITREQRGLGTLNGRPFAELSKPEMAALMDLKLAGGDVEKVIAKLRNPTPGYEARAAEVLPVIERIKAGELRPDFSQGRMYEVAIHADPERFLDWDKPLAQQAPAARDALHKIGLPRVEVVRVADGWQIMADGKPQGFPYNRRQDAELRVTAGLRTDDGRETAGTVGDIYGRAARRDAEGQAAISNALRDAGIPGIRYLDAGSRGAGDGSRNYVVFDDQLIEILRKYGLLGPTVASAGLLASQDSEAAAR